MKNRYETMLQIFLLSLFVLSGLASCSTLPQSQLPQVGTASWYGKRFQGRKTASGESFDMYQMTAAHRSLPFGSHVIVKSRSTGKQVRVRINDRGPYKGDRVIDLSYAAAVQLDMIQKGEDQVEIQPD